MGWLRLRVPGLEQRLNIMPRSLYIVIAYCLLSFLLVPRCVRSATMLYLEHAETLDFDERLHPDAQILRGNVRFRHDDALMFCDSAYYYEKDNSLDAFGHVRFVQGDTLFGYGDKLYYDGNTKFARLRNNVRLVDKKTVLTTDSLNYDRLRDLAWYYSGGQIKDSVNTLTSRWGQYTSGNKQALFRGGVHLVNDRFVMDSDTLKYNTDSHVADLVGETVILYEKETTIFSTLGWYNTETEYSVLLRHSLVVHDSGSSLTGDTIRYDKRAGFGKALRNIQMTDSANHLTLYGHYCEMYEHGSQGDNSGFATDSALLVDWSDSLSYTYMHADTLFTEEVPYRVYTLVPRDSVFVDSVLVAQTPDTLWRDTSYRQIRGYYGMRLFRSDMQAVGDSIVYNGRDSVMALFGKPVAWSDNQQVSAEHIDIYMKNKAVDYAHGTGSALAVEQKFPTCFNQLSGKEMFAYVRKGKLRQIDVNGNAETIFYPQEDDGTFVGINKTQSSFVKIFLTEESKIDRVLFTTATTGAMYPFDELGESQTRLTGFFWADAVRPRSAHDVFRKAEVELPETKGLSAAEQEDDEAGRHRNKGTRTKDKGAQRDKGNAATGRGRLR